MREPDIICRCTSSMSCVPAELASIKPFNALTCKTVSTRPKLHAERDATYERNTPSSKQLVQIFQRRGRLVFLHAVCRKVAHEDSEFEHSVEDPAQDFSCCLLAGTQQACAEDVVEDLGVAFGEGEYV